MSHLDFLSQKILLTGVEVSDIPTLAPHYKSAFQAGANYQFDGKPVHILNFPSSKWTGHTYFFHHLCTRSHESNKHDRYYSMERAELMPWSKDLLLNYKSTNLLVWKQIHKIKFRRVYIYAQSCDYVAILEDNNFNPDPLKRVDQYTFVTAYNLTEDFERRSLMDSYGKRINGWTPK